MENILPWILPNMAILMASYTQSFELDVQVVDPSETLGIKSNVLSHVNKRLEQDFTAVAMETLPAVMHLVLVEVGSPSFYGHPSNETLQWWWGNTNSLWAHIKGAKQMLKLCGGLEGIKDTMLSKILIL